MKVFCTDSFQLPLPANHRFQIEKYQLLRERVTADLGHRLQSVVPAAATDRQLAQAHDAAYLRKVERGRLTALEQRRIGFPWSQQLVERSRRSTGATLEAGRAALDDGMAVNLAGGTHHASAARGQGFCVYNDVAVATRVLQSELRIRRAIVIDCDVHQGNGTAAIFAGDPAVFTFSMHGDRNFPFSKTAGDLDIALPDGAGDEQYLKLLADVLQSRIPWDGADIVFYLAGADPFENDRLGRLRLSKTGLRSRDRLVLSTCRTANLPVVITMAGGYARNIEDTVDIHAGTVSVACETLAVSLPIV